MMGTMNNMGNMSVLDMLSYCVENYNNAKYSTLVSKTKKFIELKGDKLANLPVSKIKSSQKSVKEFFPFWNFDASEVYEPFSTQIRGAFWQRPLLSGLGIILTWESVISGEDISPIENYSISQNIKFKAALLSYSEVINDMSRILNDIEDVFSRLEDGGVLTICVNHLFFQGKTGIQVGIEDLTKALLEQNALEAIVDSKYLDRLFILRKNKEHNGIWLLSRRIFDSKQKSEYEDEYYRKYLTPEQIETCRYDVEDMLGFGELDIQPGEAAYDLSMILLPYQSEMHNDTYGRVFKYRNQAKNFNTVVCDATTIDEDFVDSSMVKVTGRVGVIHSDLRNPMFTYVVATDKEPVYFRKDYLVYKLDESKICPEYLYLLFYNGRFSKCLTETAISHLYSNWYGTYMHDGQLYETPNPELVEKLISPEMEAYDMWLSVPRNLDVQREQVDNAMLIAKVLENKIKARELLFNNKEWLNEQHIRNIKHRIKNGLTPISTDLMELIEIMKMSDEGITLTDIFSLKSKRTVGDMLQSLVNMTLTVGANVEALTKTIRNGKRYTKTSLKSLLDNYAEKSPFTNQCAIELLYNSMEDLELIVCTEDMVEVFDLIFENAVRHGFSQIVDKLPKMRIFAREMKNGQLILDISNNGAPISERGKEEYFVRGSYAGKTGHSGIGGARIKEVIEANSGRAEIFADLYEDFPVTVRLHLPVDR